MKNHPNETAPLSYVKPNLFLGSLNKLAQGHAETKGKTGLQETKFFNRAVIS